MLAAVYGRADPTRSLVLRGISDFGDARKKELDEVGAGGLRRYGMRNAVRLLGVRWRRRSYPASRLARRDPPAGF